MAKFRLGKSNDVDYSQAIYNDDDADELAERVKRDLPQTTDKFVTVEIEEHDIDWPTLGSEVKVQRSGGRSRLRGEIEFIGGVKTDGDRIMEMREVEIQPTEDFNVMDLPDGCNFDGQSGMVFCRRLEGKYVDR